MVADPRFRPRRRCGVRRIAAVLFLALLAGCAAAPQTDALRKALPADLPSRVELDEVPFFPQERYQCGPAALATVLTHAGRPTRPEALVSRVYLPERKGSVPVEMVAAARGTGLLVYPLAPRLTALLRETAAGHPVLVLQNLAFDWSPRWHYAVLIGFDLKQGSVILRSGTTRRWITPLSTFERTWARAGHRAWVILPPGEIPATARPVPYLSAAADLEQTGQREAALAAWQAAVRTWPDEPRAWLTWGNALYDQGDVAGAAEAFRRAVALRPGDPMAWNNLAYALLADACPVQAVRAIDCALRLAPADANLHDSREEIGRQALGRDRAGCPRLHCPAETAHDP